MKTIVKSIVCLLIIVLTLSCALVGCDLGRKLQGIEVKFQKKVEAATQLSFDLDLSVSSSDGDSRLAVSCYKNGDEYAYTFVDPSNSSVKYRHLYADQCLYEFVYSEMPLVSKNVGSYYTHRDVPFTDEDNVLYWVTRNIMLATYAALLSSGQKDKVGDVDTYRYDFRHEGNDYSLWYDDANLVKVKATFYEQNEAGETTSETYTAVFDNYRFGEVDRAPFYRPGEDPDASLVESPISFEQWMSILNTFSQRAAHWLS